MNNKALTVGLVQHACGDSREANLDTSIQGIRRAAQQGAQLVLLQELHGSRYFCQTADASYFSLAETIPGPTTGLLAQVAAELGIVIVASLFERRSSGVYHNTAVVLESDGRIAGCYRKMHIPDDPGYHEKYYFTPGDLGFEPVSTSVGRLGVLVCWDQWFPEAARLMALAGADVLLYPTAIGWDTRDDKQAQQRQQDAWLTVQRGHAIANCLPVMVCNRTGHETDPSARSDGIQFWGGSCIIGPQGEMLAQTGAAGDDVLVAAIDFSRTEALRQLWPFLRDRRIDAYQDLLKRFRD
ncbi:MAG: carbon-nitrogen hydrolase [Gammaproteobacteria bacterium]